MTIKQIFTLLENSNKFNELIEEKTNHITFCYDTYSNFQAKTFKEFRVKLKEEINDDFISLILNADFIQDTKYKNTFIYDHYEIEINLD